jgi:acetyl esterase/lipase
MSTPAPYLDPLNQALADQLATQPALQDLSVSQFRALFEQLQEHQPVAGVTRTSFTVPGEHGVEAFVFKSNHAAKSNLPVIFYLHGGAWISGS